MKEFEISLDIASAMQGLSGTPLKDSGPMDSSLAGREILELVEAVSAEMGQELKLFGKALGSTRYTPRLFVYKKRIMTQGSRWLACDLELASSEFLSGSLDNLRALMDACSEKERDGNEACISMWVHPMPLKELETFMVFVRHVEGVEAAFVAGEGKWSALPQSEQITGMTLSMLLSLSSNSRRRWAGVVNTQKRFVTEAARPALRKILVSKGARDVSDKYVDSLIAAVCDTDENLEVIKSIAREFGTAPIHEAQNVLTAAVGLVDRAIEITEEKVEQLVKDHARSIKKFKADLEKYKMVRDGAEARTRQRDKELSELRKQLRTTSSTPAKIEGSIGVALDAFFPT